MKQENLKKIIWEYFQSTQIIHFATCDKDKPKVRPVTLFYFKEQFYILTFTNDAKVRQIMQNPEYEFSYLVDDEDNVGYIRASGIAEIIIDQELKKDVAENCYYFNQFWKDYNDNSYTLIKLLIEQIEFMAPGYNDIENLVL